MSTGNMKLVEDLIPPLEMRSNKDPKTYFDTARSNITQIEKYVEISEDAAILDVGCAAGRLAFPFIGRLKGTYDGFDIRKEQIDWATNNITKNYPNFRFTYFDIKNEWMNRSGGTVEGSQFSFPYADSSFDLIIYHSIFTHLMPDVAKRYLAESSRILKDTGSLYITFYVWDRETESCVANNETQWRFAHQFGECRVHDPERPEYAVSFHRDWIYEEALKNGLHIKNFIQGSWRNARTHGQDYYIFRKHVS